MTTLNSEGERLIPPLRQGQVRGLNAPQAKSQREVAGSWTTAAQVFVTIYMILGVIGGISLASTTTGSEYFNGSEQHPFVALGLGTILFVITTGVTIMAGLQFMQWRIKVPVTVTSMAVDLPR